MVGSTSLHHHTFCSHKEVPVIFREPYIHTGYRPPGRNWWYYIGSLFQLHNETINIWSHLLAAVYFTYWAYYLGQWQLDYREDPLTWAVLGFTVGTVGYTLLSALAHLLHAKSAQSHFLCYQLDYVGICLDLQGSGIAAYFLVGDVHFHKAYNGWVFLLLNALWAVAVCGGCSISKLGYRRPYSFVSKLWRLIPGLLSAVCGSLPVFYRTYSWLSSGATTAEDGKLLMMVYVNMAWTTLGVFFFITYIPERYAPGCFDIFGHSHSLFHLILVYTSQMWYNICVLAYQQLNPQLRTAMTQPSVTSIFGFQLLAVSLCLFIIYLTRHMRARRVASTDALIPNNNKRHIQKLE